MANNNIQPTHEAIHTGLSGLGQDEKWKDMLNFRSQQNRTQVVPHKYLWFSAGCAKLHSFIAGLNGHALAIGEHQSFGFIGSDSVNAYQLWRLTQRFLKGNSNRDAQSQQLLVQGSYTGTAPVKLRVHYVAGKLIPFWDTPAPLPTPPAETVPDFGCDPDDSDGSDGAKYHTLRFTIRNHDLTTDDEVEYLKDVRITVQRLGDDYETSFTDSRGLAVFTTLKKGYYSVTLTKEGFKAQTHSFELSTTSSLTYSLVEDNPAWSTLARTYQPGQIVHAQDPEDYNEFVDESPFGHLETSGPTHYLFMKQFVPADPGDVNINSFSVYGHDADGDTVAIRFEGWDIASANDSAGDIVIRKHTLYRCLVDIPNNDPVYYPGTGANWRAYWTVIRNDVPYSGYQQYVAGDRFYPGQKVTYLGNRYRCITEHQAILWPISTTPENWELLP